MTPTTPGDETSRSATPHIVATSEPASTLADDSAPAGSVRSVDPVPPEIVLTAEAVFGEGGIYVAHLLRPSDVPLGWQLDRAPQFQARDPQPGDTYRFACEMLQARSTGVATVGYRSLEGLPSLSVEYVLYPSSAAAEAALDDMHAAADTCGEFNVPGVGGSDIWAQIEPITFSDFGEDSFAAALETESDATGRLLTHVIKIRQGNVIVGINHAVQAGESLPNMALSEEVADLTLAYLSQVQRQ